MAGRQKPTDKTQGIAKVADVEYNEYAGAKKVLGPILGKLIPIGSASSQKSIDPGSTVAFYNINSSTKYVKIGTGTLIAPTGPTNGIPLPPLSYTILAMGSDNAFISDHADVYAFEVLDDSRWQ
jgi:hypothetical protein